MMDPRALYAEKLRDLVAAGSRGLALADIGAGTALHMGMYGLAEITNSKEPPERVVATREARLRLQQQEWAA